MKIVVIGVARSRTEVLVEKLRILNPELSCHYEYYSYRIKKTQSENKLLTLTNELFSGDNYIVKILASNILESNGKIQDLHLEKYDAIYLIERPDFFNQCCSLQVCKNVQLWHQRKNHVYWRAIRGRQFHLEDIVVQTQIKNVNQYIKIKQYLHANKIPYTLQDYNDPFDIVPKTVLSDPKLSYENMITNYHMQPVIDNLFNKHFNYQSCFSNLDSFLIEYSNVQHEFT